MKQKFNELSVKSYTGAKKCINYLKKGVNEFLNDENAVSGIIVAVILVLVAVVILAVFQEELNQLTENLWKDIKQNTDSLEKGEAS